MGWLASLFVGVVTALAGLLGSGLLASVFVEWFRISSFEGGAGYYVVGLGLLGLAGGFAIGVVVARVVARRPRPTLRSALGRSLAALGVVLVAVAGLGWLAADFPPTRDGRALELEVEVRLPAGVDPAAAPESEAWRWHVTITADTGGRRQSMGLLAPADGDRGSERRLARAVVRLASSAAGRTLGVGLGDRDSQYLRLALGSRPRDVDFEWSDWQPATFHGDLTPIAEQDRVEVRYRVRAAAAQVAGR